MMMINVQRVAEQYLERKELSVGGKKSPFDRMFFHALLDQADLHWADGQQLSQQHSITKEIADLCLSLTKGKQLSRTPFFSKPQDIHATTMKPRPADHLEVPQSAMMATTYNNRCPTPPTKENVTPQLLSASTVTK